MTDLWYLATPDTNFPYGINSAAQTAGLMAANLIQKGENIFCPIVHSHFLCVVSGLDPLDHEFWMDVDKAYMEKCTGLIVGMLPTWTKSKGMAMEIAAFKKMGKPIRYFDPETGLFTSEVLN